MKRHPSLHRLSHDHHHGLVQARWLQDAAARGQTGDGPVARAFLQAWAGEIAPHFVREEKLLLPHLSGVPEAARLLEEHRRLRSLVQRIHSLGPAELRELGATLHDHIQWEERELFPLLEQKLSDQELAVLEAALEEERPVPPESKRR